MKLIDVPEGKTVQVVDIEGGMAVSYTHLTLPTKA